MIGARLKSISLLFTLVLFLWPVLTALTIPQGTVTEQIFTLSHTFWPHALNFGMALLIAPLLLTMLWGLVQTLYEPPARIFAVLATFFYLAYFFMATISYGSQTLFKLLFMQRHTSMDTLLNWYFYQEPSLVGYINQTGYLCYAIATLLLFIPLCSIKNSLLKAINTLLIISALLQITANLAHYLEVPFIGKLTILSGLLLLPTGILIYLYARRLETVK